ncbi:MAG: hypothetical protein ACSHXB_10685 [Sulfitobacter sp.]
MTNVTLGKLDFTVKEGWVSRQIGGKFDPYFSDALNRRTMSKKMQFLCDGLQRIPDPFPKVFEMVEPQLLVYSNDIYVPKNHAGIDAESERFGALLLRETGHIGGLALEQEINKKFGVHDIPFNVEAAIAPLTNFRLKIKVTLIYEHYRLQYKGMPSFTRVILSLPHRVDISAQRTHICHPGGVAKLPKVMRYMRNVTRTHVRATTDEAFDLRGAAQRRWIKDRKKYIEKAKEDIANNERELEQMRPESD